MTTEGSTPRFAWRSLLRRMPVVQRTAAVADRLPAPLIRSAPVAASVVIHILFLAVAVVLLWRASTPTAPARTAVVHFDDPSPAPAPDHAGAVVAGAPGPARAPERAVAAPLPESLIPKGMPEPSPLAGLATTPAQPGGAPVLYSTSAPLARAQDGGPTGAPGATVKFAGLGSSTVRSVVYVVDASGPMVTSLPDVFQELEASVSRLTGSQKFGVVIFRDASDQADTHAAAGPTESFMPILVRATPDAKQRLAQWLKGIRPRGRSNPMDGLRAGIGLHPEAIFLLSRSIERSEGGVWGLGKDETLREIDALNPVDAASDRREASIQTIQFLDPDPSGIMQEIGRRHSQHSDVQGVAPTDAPGYRYIPRGTPLGGN